MNVVTYGKSMPYKKKGIISMEFFEIDMADAFDAAQYSSSQSGGSDFGTKLGVCSGGEQGPVLFYAARGNCRVYTGPTNLQTTKPGKNTLIDKNVNLRQSFK